MSRPKALGRPPRPVLYHKLHGTGAPGRPAVSYFSYFATLVRHFFCVQNRFSGTAPVFYRLLFSAFLRVGSYHRILSMSRRNPRRGARNARRRGPPAVLLSDDEAGDSSSDDEQFEEQMRKAEALSLLAMPAVRPPFAFPGKVSRHLECPICQEVFQQATRLSPCGHVYCGPCIQEWLTKSKSCPTCRTPVTRNENGTRCMAGRVRHARARVCACVYNDG